MDARAGRRVLAVDVLTAGVQRHGTCEGIGFGCRLNPRDGALFVGVLVGLPALAATVVVAVFILALLSRTNMRSGVWAGNLAMFGGLVVTVAVGAALSLL